MTSGRPLLSQTACSLEFRPPLVRRIRRGKGPFLKGPGGGVGLQMRGVDHDPPGLAAFARQGCENLVEHAQAAPTKEPIVDRLVRAILSWRVPPTQPIL